MVYGEWWVDSRKRYPRPYVPPQHTAAGELFDDGFTGWRLETLGPLLSGPIGLSSSNAGVGDSSEPLTVWGTDRDGYFYSLLNTHHWRTQHQSPNVRGGVQTWPVSVIVKSRDDWVTPSDLVDQIDVYLQDLDAWASDPSELHTDHDRESKTVSISVETRSATATVGKAEVEARWGRNVSSSIEHVSASPGAVIRIVDTLPISEIANQWSSPLSQLMSLLMMRTSVVDRIDARLARKSAADHPEYVEVRIPQPVDDDHRGRSESSIVKRQHEMLATRRALASAETTWDRLLPGFFGALDDDEFKTTLSLLIASQEKTEGFRFDDSLLYAFNAIESFHRTRFDGTVTEEPRVAKVLKEMKQRVPRGLKAVINPRLAATRHKRMLEKIDDILGICGTVAADLSSACPDLASVLHDARTASAHATTERMSAQDQVDALVSTQWLLRHGLLQSLGIDSQACDQIIRQNFEFKGHTRALGRRHSHRTPPAERH
ncbi:MAG: hypothetical protein OXH86_17165 [Acidimicrobiaceae bacterium]|nr:hypothetical protein [Acidimicrobiaceae bacterium]MDE0499073.1 hypothetical protein [Acidimicrobiaceae bacterium]